MTPKEAQGRAAIVAEALSWDMTPFQSHQRLKGLAVDCAQLPIAVYSATGFIPELNPDYGAQWMLHRDEELYLAEIRQWAHDIPLETARAGDLIVWKFGRSYSHSGIVVDPPLIIHAWARVRMVVQSDMTAEEELRSRPCLAFSVFPSAHS